MNGSRRRVDVEQIRARHRLVDVVAASGVRLHPRGQGYIGCCPFHDDHTPSMSVGAVAERFHCFACGATGDVIEFVMRLHRRSFKDAIALLQTGHIQAAVSPLAAEARAPRRPVSWCTTRDRVVEVNELAWAHLTSGPRARAASSWLKTVRGIGIAAVQAAEGGSPVVGLATSRPGNLTTELLVRHGVTQVELLDADLARRQRDGRLVDTLRGRLIVPIRDADGALLGLVGRDVTGSLHAPKYRNPTRTPAFDKASALYRPSRHPPAADVTVVVVEGVLDALAIAAAAAAERESARWAPVTTSGLSVSDDQATKVLAVSWRQPVIALDGDHAGREGADRWVQALARHGSDCHVVRLPDGVDPAGWLAAGGDLSVFSPGVPRLQRRAVFASAAGPNPPKTGHRASSAGAQLTRSAPPRPRRVERNHQPPDLRL